MTILDNQEVDAAILNGIAKDLGATVFDKFKDGVKFGVDELNDITAALVTPGVLGNDGDSCKVVIVDGKISVSTGTIVFASGAKMKITEPQLLEVVPNIKTYVVAVNDTTNNRMLLYNSEALPEGEDFVLLGEVSADGKAFDTRAWATAKIVGMAGPVYEHIEEDVELILKKDGSSLPKTINLTRSGYHAIYMDGLNDNYRDRMPVISLDGSPVSCTFGGDSKSYFNLDYDGKSTVKIYARASQSLTSDQKRTVHVSIYFF